MAASSSSQAKKKSKEIKRPLVYEERVKGQEFSKFLELQGLVVAEGQEMSRVASSEDSKAVYNLLHPAVRLLLSSTKLEKWSKRRNEVTELLLQQTAAYNAHDMVKVSEISKRIDAIIEKEHLSPSLDTVNIEVDIYTHAFSEKENLPPVIPLSVSTMGIKLSITPLHSHSPERRPTITTEKPCTVTPNAKGNSNLINVGEVASLEASLVKKVAQLECATTYAHLRATQANARDAGLLEVVGYAALGMSMMDRSSVAAAMITLHPDWFPNLGLLQEMGSLAYLFSRRGVFEDITSLIDSCGGLSAEMAECKEMTRECKEELKELQQHMDCQYAEMHKQVQRLNHVLLFIGITVGAFLWFRRF